MSDSPSEPRAKRQRVDRAGRFAALERLKNLKGSKNKYNVEEQVDDVYEIVDEKDYVKRAKEKYGEDWIEDDGTGYQEDGRDFFEDEDYSDDEGAGGKRNAKGAKKRSRDESKPAKGKGSLRNLFSNAVPKKKESAIKLAEDDVLADILGELDDRLPQELGDKNSNHQATSTDKATPSSVHISKKSDATLAKEYINNFISNIKMKEPAKNKEDSSDDEMIERIMKPKVLKKENAKSYGNVASIITSTECVKLETVMSAVIEEMKPKSTEAVKKSEEKSFAANCEDDVTVKNEFSVPSTGATEAKIESKVETSQLKKLKLSEEDEMKNLLNNWESICQMDNFEEEQTAASCPTTEGDELNNENLKFWYWEAWEDANKRPGEVFLFGKTTDNKSICVRVENIDHVIYLLPRPFLLDPISKEPTRQKVTVSDTYQEFDNDISVGLKLDGFRSKKVIKNFAYHSIGVNVPEQCEYLEVHYDGKKPAPNIKKKYNSIDHIFGANTTALERFLLDRKIKGPCWLTLKNFKVNTTQLSWCKMEVTCSTPRNIQPSEDPKPAPPSPLSLLTVNVRTAVNPKTMKNEIIMISCLVNNRFNVDKPPPNPPFNRNFCGFTRPITMNWPLDLNAKLSAQCKSTKYVRHDTERALLNWFIAIYQSIDPDLIVTNDVNDCQLDVICDRIVAMKIPNWSRLGRLRMTQSLGKRVLDFFVGRMVCDVKKSAEELIRARSFDLNTLCTDVLHLKENERMNINEDELLQMYETGDGVSKLISLTMQDCLYILRIMCELNVMPLALQITNICGNIMSKTLQGGRSERNEFLLLHAFTEKNYIVPDKPKRQSHWNANNGSATAGGGDSIADGDGGFTDITQVASAAGGGRKKAAYTGGLVLDPIRGLYDKYILLMDFNSLYPSIIQEYNICFTTVQQPLYSEDLPKLPESSVDQGILPRQIRRLVESRREVKKLMAAPDLEPELRIQYDIRQLALKLTANSMYGCLGFANSRFYAQHLAALVTHKGREILMNTKSLVQTLSHEVVYGDTDSIMVNTNMDDYDQVFKIGNSIKQTVNKMYKQLELDIDGVYKCLLLLKKKKYAAMKVSKTAKGELKYSQELKGLDIVRRDWSQIASTVGRVVLEEILSDKQLDDKIECIHSHLEKVKENLLEGLVPAPLFVITKQLSKAPKEFTSTSAQPHVQVALRMNATKNRRYKKGDMVDYVICIDGTEKAATQRAYHLDELKSDENLKIDINYYLAFQIHPVITRMCEVLEGTDASRIAECLGLDPTKFRAAAQRSYQDRSEDAAAGESIVKTALQKYQQYEKFTFVCVVCKAENVVASAFKPGASNHTYTPVLQKCSNTECSAAPFQYVISIRNQLILQMRKFITRFYQNWMVCDDPACNNNTRNYTHVTSGNRPICVTCKNGTLVRQYSERDLYHQLSYLQYMFDLSKHQHKSVTLTPEVELAYATLRDTVDQQLNKSAYCTISLGKLFSNLKMVDINEKVPKLSVKIPSTSSNQTTIVQ